MDSRDLAGIIADNERKHTPKKKLSRKKSYLIGNTPGLKNLYSPHTSWVRFQYAGGGIEYHALKNLHAGGRKAQPAGAYGCVKICREPLRDTAQGLISTEKVYAEKIQEREDHHTSRAFEVQVMHEWKCLCEVYGDLPLPTFIIDKHGELTKAYLAMPIIPGMSLRKFKDYYADTTPCSDLLTIIINMLSQLKMLHEKGMTHRDIRLENFIFDAKTLTITIIDFGLTALPSEKEREFCREYGVDLVIDATYEGNAYWWDLCYCREAALELLSGIDPGSDRQLIDDAKEVLFSAHEYVQNGTVDINGFIAELEALRDARQALSHVFHL